MLAFTAIVTPTGIVVIAMEVVKEMSCSGGASY
jgi:hypothetical protein